MNWYTPVAILAFCLFFYGNAYAHDPENPDLNQWYASLMQPDNPTVSCCGEADGYWCEDIHVKELVLQGVKQKATTCRITDNRPDEPLNRMHVDIGTEIIIPDHKLTYKYGNPTGHSLVFLSKMQYVYCFIQTGGI